MSGAVAIQLELARRRPDQPPNGISCYRGYTLGGYKQSRWSPMSDGTRHGHDAAQVGFASVPWPVAVSATLHCLIGCAIGEVLGMVIGTALGRPGELAVLGVAGLRPGCRVRRHRAGESVDDRSRQGPCRCTCLPPLTADPTVRAGWPANGWLLAGLPREDPADLPAGSRELAGEDPQVPRLQTEHAPGR